MKQHTQSVTAPAANHTPHHTPSLMDQVGLPNLTFTPGTWLWAMQEVLNGNRVRRVGWPTRVANSNGMFIVGGLGNPTLYSPDVKDITALDWEVVPSGSVTINPTGTGIGSLASDTLMKNFEYKTQSGQCDCGWNKWKWTDGHVKGCPAKEIK